MAKQPTTVGDLMRNLAEKLDRQRELDRLYLIKKAKAFKMFPPDNPDQIILILLRGSTDARRWRAADPSIRRYGR